MTNLLALLRQVFKDGVSIYWMLFKIMLPVSILVRFVAILGWDIVLAQYFEPLMGFVGLPGLTALIWLSAIVTNLYAAMVVFASLWYEGWLSTLQVTQLCLMMLLCHNLFIECMVSHKIGLHFLRMAIFRFATALLAGYLCQFFTWLDKPLGGEPLLQADQLISQMTWLQWFVSECKGYATIFVIIMVVIFILEVLKRLGIEKLLSTILAPCFRWLGLSSQAVSIALIGMTLGLAYGGGLMLKQVQTQRFSKGDIVFSLLLMGSFHAAFEDTLLMLLLHADWVVILLFRIIFTLTIIFLIYRLMTILPSQVNRFIFGYDTKQLVEKFSSNTTNSSHIQS